MASTDTDNATDIEHTEGAPGSGSGSEPLEQRIDELLKDVEESLESLDPTGDLEQAAAAAAERAASTEPGSTDTSSEPFDLDALSAELDGALQQAEQVVRAEQVVAPAPETPTDASEPGAVAKAEPTPTDSAVIDELDSALADAASAAVFEDGAPSPVAPVEAAAPSPEPVVEEIQAVAPPAPAPEPTPAPEPVAAAPAPVAAPTPAPTPALEPVSAPVAAPIPGAPPAPKAKKIGAIEMMLRAIASPLTLMSPAVRDLIGWLGLWVTFNAVCVWVFVLVMGPQAGGASPQSGASPSAQSTPAPKGADSATK